MVKKVENYLNKNALLREIHNSKNSYCVFADPSYMDYDIIIYDLSEINRNTILLAKQNRADRLSKNHFNESKSMDNKLKLSDCQCDITSIKKKDLIFRVITYSHIPEDIFRKKMKRNTADYYTKLNFTPFQHFKYNDDNELECVGKSHWTGDLELGEFSLTSGRINDEHAKMLMLTVAKYASKRCYRQYTYNDEMQQYAILQLIYSGLKFDEDRSDNPFGFYSRIIENVFNRILNIEKKNQNLRDDLLEKYRMDPSSTRTNSEDYDNADRKNNIDF